MRTLDRVVAVVLDQPVDDRQRVRVVQRRMAAVRLAARRLHELQVLPARREQEPRPATLRVAERHRSAQEAQGPQRARPDLEVVAVDVAGVELAERGRHAQVQPLSDRDDPGVARNRPRHLLAGRPRLGEHDEVDALWLAQRHPHRDGVLRHAPYDWAREQERPLRDGSVQLALRRGAHGAPSSGGGRQRASAAFMGTAPGRESGRSP